LRESREAEETKKKDDAFDAYANYDMPAHGNVQAPNFDQKDESLRQSAPTFMDPNAGFGMGGAQPDFDFGGPAASNQF
jgi:hypothetical protein